MSRQQVCIYKHRIKVSVELRFWLESQERHMDINQYLDWLKQQAHVRTRYDCYINCVEAQQSPEVKAKELAKHLEEA